MEEKNRTVMDLDETEKVVKRRKRKMNKEEKNKYRKKENIDRR